MLPTGSFPQREEYPIDRKRYSQFSWWSIWRHNDVFCDEIRVVAPHMLNQKSYNFDPMQLCLFSVANIFIVFAFKTPQFLPYMVMWREIWIFFIACNSTSFNLIELGFSPEIIEFYAENCYQVFTISFLNFLCDAKFGHHIWCHSSSHIGWNKHQKIGNLSAYLPAKFRCIWWIILLSICLELLFFEGTGEKALATDHRDH